MRRFFTVLAVTASALIAIPAASAQVTDLLSFEAALDQIASFDPAISELQPATPPEPGYEFTVGSLKTEFLPPIVRHTRWSAHDGPNGPSGAVRLTFEGGVPSRDLRGKVTCVEVDGNIARVAAVLSEPFEGQTHVMLQIVDRGNPVNGMSFDQDFVGFTNSPPPTCFDAGVWFGGRTTGNAIVRDDA